LFVYLKSKAGLTKTRGLSPGQTDTRLLLLHLPQGLRKRRTACHSFSYASVPCGDGGKGVGGAPSMRKTSILEPGMVVYTCNPSYLGGRRISSWRPAQAKVAARPCLKKGGRRLAA
jgi:hypothetical protein